MYYNFLFLKMIFFNLSRLLVIKFLDLDPELDADPDLTGAVVSDRRPLWVPTSVADPGCGASLTPGSGFRYG